MVATLTRQAFFLEGGGLALAASNYTHTDGGQVLGCPSGLLSLARVALVGSLLLHSSLFLPTPTPQLRGVAESEQE